MKRLFAIFLFTFFSFILNATTYYIDPAGNDGNNGTIGSPWLTLAYACTQVTTSGDIIHVNAGTYIEVEECDLSVEVSLEGVGITSIIKAGYASTPLLKLNSNDGTNGNQSISNLKFDGNALTGDQALWIRGRGNVKVHDCLFIDFHIDGVTFNGKATVGDGAPSVYPIGNEFYNNTISNCSIYDIWGYGAFNLGGQDGLLVYDNVMSQTGRAGIENGYVIKYSKGGYLKGVKFYRNTLTEHPYDGTHMGFVFELWGVIGGVEIYDNTIIGNTDLNIISKGDYPFSVDFYRNTVSLPSQSIVEAHGFELEQNCEGVIVRNNKFTNFTSSILLLQDDRVTISQKDINIYSNISIGGTGVELRSDDGVGLFDNVNIWNNTFYSETQQDGINITNGTINNLSISNNIIVGYSRSPIYGWAATEGIIDGFIQKNNCYYDNGNSNEPSFQNSTRTNEIILNNITTNPLLVSSLDFHLQSNSPAKDAGLNVGLVTDYAGHSLPQNLLYDIGAYEYGTWVLMNAGKVMTSGGKVLTITQ